MSQLDRPVALFDRSDEVGPHRARSLYPFWPPRPSTVVAAVLVGCSLFWMAFIDREFARNLSEGYGWPFHYHFEGPNDPGPSGGFYAAAMAADLAIAVALLASACATTQIAACSLVRSPRLTLRILGFVIAVIAMFLAACRLKETFLACVFYTGFYYGLASLIVLLVCLLLRLELPPRDDPEQEG
jgi:hypothetical protein